MSRWSKRDCLLFIYTLILCVANGAFHNNIVSFLCCWKLIIDWLLKNTAFIIIYINHTKLYLARCTMCIRVWWPSNVWGTTPTWGMKNPPCYFALHKRTSSALQRQRLEDVCAWNMATEHCVIQQRCHVPPGTKDTVVAWCIVVMPHRTWDVAHTQRVGDWQGEFRHCLHRCSCVMTTDATALSCRNELATHVSN